jgi:LacI family transcriptional regulator, gluconate utilization system Gnt-I transcriptional repressor
MTVSRVLRNRGDVSPATREKVLAAARELGYVPNKIAGALASQRVNLVAVIIPSLSNMVFPEVLAAFPPCWRAPGCSRSSASPTTARAREEKVLYEMLSWRPSGVILAGLEHSDASRAMLAAPASRWSRSWTPTAPPVDSVVGISHRAAGRQMAEAIAAAGYRRIGFLGTKMPDDHRARKRIEGLTETLAKHGLELAGPRVLFRRLGAAKGREMTEAILERVAGPRFPLLFQRHDRRGRAALVPRAGLDIPGRIGLAGFNGVELLTGPAARLATIDACRPHLSGCEMVKHQTHIVEDEMTEEAKGDLSAQRRRVDLGGHGGAAPWTGRTRQSLEGLCRILRPDLDLHAVLARRRRFSGNA